MVNKLNINKKKLDNGRYLRGFSIAEKEDIETSIEEALENPVGTFTTVTRELTYRLSNLNKMVKTIGVDTKYIRKVIDRLDKKIDDISADGGFNVGDALSMGAGALSLKEVGSKLKGFGKAGISKWLGRAGLVGLAYGITNTIDPQSESGEGPISGWLNRNVYDLDGKMFELFGLGVDRKKFPIGKKINNIEETIHKKMSIENGDNQPSNIFKELNPSERAEIIQKRLHMMTDVPNNMSDGIASNYGNSIDTMSGSFNRGQSGGVTGTGGGGADDTGTMKPVPPSLTPSEFRALESSNLVGTGDLANKKTPFSPGEITGKGLKRNQQEAYNTLRTEGLTDKAAKILVANLSGESLENPADVHSDPSQRNRQQKAHGIASWDDFRSRRIENRFGSTPDKLSVTEQTKALVWEMKNHYKKAWSDLNNEELPESDRMYSVIKNFESPMDPVGQTNKRFAMYKNLDVGEGTDISTNSKSNPLSVAQKVSSALPGQIQPVPERETKVIENQSKEASVRKMPIQPKLKNTLTYAAAASGVDIVSVFSGGQTEKGSAGPRTGSIRHDDGNAADIYLYKDGRKLNMEDPEDRKVMSKFISNARAAGATGIGAAPDYMGVHGIHVGFGSEKTWGAKGKSANAPDWLKNAYEVGQKMPAVDPTEWMKENKEKSERVSEFNKNNLKKGIIGYSRGLEKNESNPNKRDNIKPPKSELETQSKENSNDTKKALNSNVDTKKTKKDQNELMFDAPNNLNKKDYMAKHEMDPKKITPTFKKSDVMEELVKNAVEEAAQATAAASIASEAVKNTPINPPPKIPQTASNPTPLSKLPRTAKKGVINPTEKTPGSDSSKKNTPVPLISYADPNMPI